MHLVLNVTCLVNMSSSSLGMEQLLGTRLTIVVLPQLTTDSRKDNLNKSFSVTFAVMFNIGAWGVILLVAGRLNGPCPCLM